jgi:tetratricopeptide (TPR) repeat protein
VRLIALLLVVLLTATSDNERAMRMLNEWIDAVDRHAAGERDQPLATIGAWNTDDLQMMRAYIEAFSGVPLDNAQRAARRRQISGTDLKTIQIRAAEIQARSKLDTFRKRAVILHTDAALLESMPAIVEPPTSAAQKPAWRRGEPEPAVDVKSFDGRVERYEIANPHWQFAMDLLEGLPAKPQRDGMVAQWYRAIGAHFAREHAFADAMRHFERARRVVPDDPDVLFGEACHQETLGSPRVQNLNRVTTLPNGLVLIGVSSADTHHRRAAALLHRALALRPQFIEARLRLGRVLSELKQYDAALAHLAEVAAESRDPVLTYYAHLFAGDAALSLNRAGQSRASYERALDAQPMAQAAWLGLGAALRAAGEREAAVEAVMTTLTMARELRATGDDPWWEYYEGDAANVVRLLDELRSPFGRPAR